MTISVTKVSSLDQGYVSGDLSLFPDALDDKETLYEVKNNAETTMKQGLPFMGTNIVVEDANSFPSKGLLRIGPEPGSAGNDELVYYDSRTSNVFKNLIRGFAGSTQYRWIAGTSVGNAVMAEHHNARFRIALSNQIGGPDPLIGLGWRHPDVGDDRVGSVLFDRLHQLVEILA